jgi:prepilin-type N-terminal cleavage/methylation domain-containing protein
MMGLNNNLKDDIRMKTQMTPRGFSLMELLITLTIMSILTTLIVPAYQKYTTQAEITHILLYAQAAKTATVDAYLKEPRLELIDNASLQFPEQPPMNTLTRLQITQGVITLHLNQAQLNLPIENPTLTLSPRFDHHFLNWRCLSAIELHPYVPKQCHFTQ